MNNVKYVLNHINNIRQIGYIKNIDVTYISSILNDENNILIEALELKFPLLVKYNKDIIYINNLIILKNIYILLIIVKKNIIIIKYI